MTARTSPPKRRKRPNWELVAIGASAGGLSALGKVLGGLDCNCPPVVIVQHLDPSHESQLASLLQRRTTKTVKAAQAGERLIADTIYIGPPDEHLLVSRGRIQLAHSRLVRFSRPSIDMMFGSVAAVYGGRSIGIILSGSNRDGSDGITAIRSAGGTTIAQDPATAESSIMPQAAIDTGCIDYVVPLQEIGHVVSRLLTRRELR